MTEQQYLELFNEGYYIRVSHGTFQGKPVPNSYQLTKNTGLKTRTIACLLNKCAKDILVKRFGFKVIRDQSPTVWMNHAEHLRFYTQTKEALIIR